MKSIDQIPMPESEGKPEGVISREHLKEGFKPIMACVGTPEQFLTSEENALIFRFMARVGREHLPGLSNVDYYGNQKELEKLGFKTGREKRDPHNNYVISPIDSSDKFSTRMLNCTGVLITGRSKKTGENISFLTHQNPKIFSVADKGELFAKDLQERLKELKDQSTEGSIDAVIVGGNYIDNDKHKTDYLASIKSLSGIISDTLGFEPTVIIGPKVKDGADNVFFDNQDRRVYVCRPEVGLDSTTSFAPKDIEEKKGKW